MGAGQSEAAERVRELLERIADEAHIDAEIRVTEDPDSILGEFLGGGDEIGALIGHHGQTIDAIQHIAYRVAFRGSHARKRLVIDASGYRERRAMALRAAGDQAAEAALRDRRAIRLDPMSALERKVVHEHLKARRDVETYSEGEEPSRRLVVAPLVD